MPQRAPRPVPEGLHSITPYLVFRGDCSKALEFYQRAFGATLVSPPALTPEGTVLHAVMRIGDSAVMLSDTWQAPEVVSGIKSSLWLYVDDCDALYHRAVGAGCAVVTEMADMFWGERVGEVRDPFGHTWSIGTWQWQLTPEEVRQREEEWLRAAGS